MAIEQVYTYTRPNNSKGWFMDTNAGKAAIAKIMGNMATYIDNGQMKKKLEYVSENQVKVTQRFVSKSVKDQFDNDAAFADVRAKRQAHCDANQITVAIGSETTVDSINFD